jgi:hypothetical protein
MWRTVAIVPEKMGPSAVTTKGFHITLIICTPSAGTDEKE